MKKSVETIIIEKISELSDFKVSDIKNDSLLKEDLSFDILDLAELCMDLEDKFKLDIDIKIFYEVKTVGDLVIYIKKHNKFQ